MFALVDCDNFYVSCERVFDPKLENRPVAVLSNNDGCVVARSNEVKAAGVKMGVPYFKAKPFLDAIGAAVLSSNYALYGDMSRRVARILAEFVPRMEIYSIDEAFLDFSTLTPAQIEPRSREIRATVKRWTGIPVSVGAASTKTLAKLANHLAKKRPEFDGAFVLTGSEEMIDAVLRTVPVEEVWGVGYRNAPKLRARGIRSSLDLKRAEDAWIRRRFGVRGLRVVHELRGISCISLDEAPPPRKSVCSSRSFGRPVESLDELREAVAGHAARAAKRLRGESLLAGAVTVFIHTNMFGPAAERSYNSATRRLVEPTHASAPLIQAAKSILDAIHQPGRRYRKAGALLTELVVPRARVADLFNRVADERQSLVCRVMDEINHRYGAGTVFHAAEGVAKPWEMKRHRLSPARTTRWDQLLEVE